MSNYRTEEKDESHETEFNPRAEVYVVRSSVKAHIVRCGLYILVKGVRKTVLSRSKQSVMSERRQANMPDV
jgi:hypothetical protein